MMVELIVLMRIVEQQQKEFTVTQALCNHLHTKSMLGREYLKKGENYVKRTNN